MPAAINERAEKVLMKISDHLRNMQSSAFAVQDRLAKKTDETFQSRKNLILKKGVAEGVSLAATGLVATNISFVQKLFPTDFSTENRLKVTERIAGAVSALALEPTQNSVELKSQQNNVALQELASFQQILQNIISTHDQALQRLQNMEAANRQA